MTDLTPEDLRLAVVRAIEPHCEEIAQHIRQRIGVEKVTVHATTEHGFTVEVETPTARLSARAFWPRDPDEVYLDAGSSSCRVTTETREERRG